MYCKKCGSELRDDAVFCLECGTQVRQTTITNIHNASKVEKVANKKKNLLPLIVCVAGVLVVVGVVIFNMGKSEDKPLAGTEIVELESTEEVVEEMTEEKTGKEVEEIEKQSEEELKEEREDEMGSDKNTIHRYEIVTGDVTWQEAYEDCIVRGGYLVHINSKEEFDTIVEQIKREEKTKYTFWLGANREDDSYNWINADGSRGKESINDFSYEEYWLENEPSFTGADAEGNQVSEEYVDMFYSNSAKRFYWNDVPNDIISVASYLSGKVAYICEYEE